MFPELYHAHHSLSNEDLPFWLEEAYDADGELLELGCGTGRVLLPLAQRMPRVFGLDRDGSMLLFLRRRLTESDQCRVRLIQADFTCFRFALRFKCIFLPCNTYSTLSELERQRLLEKVGAHLAPTGRFVCSLPNPTVLMGLPERSHFEVEEIFPHPSDGEPVQVSSGWRRSPRKFTLNWRYDHLFPDGSVKSQSASVTHYLTPVQTYMDELKSAGFSVVNLWGDFDRMQYSSESPNLIFEARLE